MTRVLTDEEFVEALRLCRLADAAAEGGQTPAGHYLGKLRDLLAPDQAALDRAAADQAHRDDLARDVARLVAGDERGTALHALWPELHGALVKLTAAYGIEDRSAPSCGSWPLGWDEADGVTCVLPRGHDGDCRSSDGGRWTRSPDRTPRDQRTVLS